MSVVAISRQVGSQGEKIAELTAKKLGLDLLTRDRIHELTTQCSPGLGQTSSIYESEVVKSFWARQFFNSAKHAALFEWLTFKLASQGNIILLGRGTPVVLRYCPSVFRVRIVAPFHLRCENIEKVQGISSKEAEHFVSSYGRLRRDLIESIFKVNISDPELYDLQLNSAEISLEDCADILATAIGAKAKSKECSTFDLAWMATVKKVALKIKKELNPGFWQVIEAGPGETGQVIISGVVFEQEKRNLAEQLALEVDGVEKVDNRIVVMNPAPSTD